MDISRTTRTAHTSVKNNINELLQMGFIQASIEQKGKRRFPVYTAQQDARAFKQWKKVYNLISLETSGVIEAIMDMLSPKTLVIFGSFQRGEDIETSDIDLFVECKKEKIDLERYGKKLGRKIELHFNHNFNTYPGELKNNIINGIVLRGFLEGYR